MTLEFFTGTYGASKNPAFIYTAQERDGLTWYAAEGSVNVNATYDEITDGVDIETLQDVDTFTAPNPINSLDELEAAIEL